MNTKKSNDWEFIPRLLLAFVIAGLIFLVARIDTAQLKGKLTALLPTPLPTRVTVNRLPAQAPTATPEVRLWVAVEPAEEMLEATLEATPALLYKAEHIHADPNLVYRAKRICEVQTGRENGSVFVLSGPGLDYEPVAYVYEGEILEITGAEVNGWSPVWNERIEDAWFNTLDWCREDSE